jgi:choline dehydrogenase-like flavoprotein
MPLAPFDALQNDFDVCVAGSGPAGLACALRCHELGLKTLLLEAGGERPTPGQPDILAAEIAEPRFHDPTNITSAAALGGTSHWWGGRCVPFDPIDFETWPISYEDLLPWYERAGAFFGARGVHEGVAPGRFGALQDFDATRDETWCPQINMAKRWRAALQSPNGPAVVTNARVTGLDIQDSRVASVVVQRGEGRHLFHARHVVLACGGLGALRLLLLAQRDQASLFGGASGPLGRGYMGHLTGVIANLAPADRSDATALAFHALKDGVDARRRITARHAMLERECVPNIAFWIDNAANENPAHGSSVASAKYFAARLARWAASFGRSSDSAPLKPHLDNIARAPVSAAAGFGRAMYLLAMAQLTGGLPRSRHFTPASAQGWLMRYHAEQKPNARNRVSLHVNETDSLGLPKLHIDFTFSAADCEAVVRAHEILDADLRRAGAGQLEWLGARDECISVVRDFARDGYHQLGGAAMSADSGQGVVNPDCRVHGIENLWLATSAVFPTGGQANPTLTIVALALRLAERLKRQTSAAA